MIQSTKDKEIKLISKESLKKKIKVVQMKKLTDAPCESNINTSVEEHVSSENIHFDIVFCWWWSRYSIKSSQQTVKQIEFIQEVILPKVSKRDVSVMKKTSNLFQEKDPYLGC